MSWWTTNNRIHPKTKDKFIVVFGSTFFIPSVKSVGKPKVSFETKEFRLINHKFNYPGNATWEPITIKFVDMNGDINPKQRHEIFDTAAFLWQQSQAGLLNRNGSIQCSPKGGHSSTCTLRSPVREPVPLPAPWQRTCPCQTRTCK